MRNDLVFLYNGPTHGETIDTCRIFSYATQILHFICLDNIVCASYQTLLIIDASEL